MTWPVFASRHDGAGRVGVLAGGAGPVQGVRERVLGHPLDVGVHGQHEVVAACRRRLRLGARHPAEPVDLQPLHPVPPAQLLVVDVLEAGRADQAVEVVALLLPVLVELGLRDGRQVAELVGGQRSVRVTAGRPAGRPRPRGTAPGAR